MLISSREVVSKSEETYPDGIVLSADDFYETSRMEEICPDINWEETAMKCLDADGYFGTTYYIRDKQKYERELQEDLYAVYNLSGQIDRRIYEAIKASAEAVVAEAIANRFGYKLWEMFRDAVGRQGK